jgi:arylsulfatase A-like enzyme/Tfp pilus assembly protein PilF
MRRRLLLLGVFIVTLAGLALWLWPRPRPHLLLITLDTTRADRLGCYGYQRGRTRVLDGLAASGVLCERAYTVAPITLPAHASLFTGLYPDETGVRRNGHGRLDDSIPTLAEILKQQGYETAAFVSSLVLNGKFGLNRGFDLYDDEFWRMQPPGSPNHRRRNGAAVASAALKWLGRPRTRPFFCWVHFYDPHAPCSPHPELFGDAFAQNPYDAEIAYLDQQVGRLVDFLKARQLDSETLVVVVGDHGEGLGEHFEPEHGLTLYNTTMHVPLMFRQPGRLVAGRPLSANVSLVDIFPTVLDLLGVEGAPAITGRSFQQALLGGDPPATACYGVTDEPFAIFGCAPLLSLTEGNWKYIRSTRPELYDIAADPGERNNLVESDPERRQEMEARLSELQLRLAPRGESRVRLSATERQALEALGYLRGAPAAKEPDGGKELPDIKEILPFEMGTEEAANLFKSGASEAAIDKLRAIVREAPAHARATWLLAWGLCEQSNSDEALDVFRNLLAVRPESHTGHFGLGFVLLQRDQLEDAIPEFRKALKADPDYVEAHFRLAEALFCTGEITEAQSHLEGALENDPGHIGAAQLQAYLRDSAGRIDAARAEYRAALKEASKPGRKSKGRGTSPSGVHAEHP